MKRYWTHSASFTRKPNTTVSPAAIRIQVFTDNRGIQLEMLFTAGMISAPRQAGEVGAGAQVPQRVGGEELAQLHLEFRVEGVDHRLRLLAPSHAGIPEGHLAHVAHEDVARRHVAEAGARGAHAEVHFLAIARAV